MNGGAFLLREFGQIGTQLVTYSPEHRQPFCFRAVERRRVFKAVMQPVCRAKNTGQDSRALSQTVMTESNFCLQNLRRTSSDDRKYQSPTRA